MNKLRYIIVARWDNGSVTTDGWYTKEMANEVARDMVKGNCIGTLVCEEVSQYGDYAFTTDGYLNHLGKLTEQSALIHG